MSLTHERTNHSLTGIHRNPSPLTESYPSLSQTENSRITHRRTRGSLTETTHLSLTSPEISNVTGLFFNGGLSLALSFK
ncbi:hypothetical protein A2U01_0062426, partial [Trifolium medium]|nr:hypothetical protein [Trifolium medium]